MARATYTTRKVRERSGYTGITHVDVFPEPQPIPAKQAPTALLKSGARTRRKAKPADIARTVELCARSKRISDEIRARVQLAPRCVIATREIEWTTLDPLPDNFYRVALAAEAAKRAPVPKATRMANKPDAEHTRKVAERAIQANRKGRENMAKSNGNGTTPDPDVFRMHRPDLEALGTPEAVAELERRRQKRQAKREARQKVTA